MSLSKIARPTATPVSNSTLGVESTERVAMTFAPEAVQQLVEQLIKYAHPIEATVRETISNAIDATMMLPESNRNAVEVFLPGAHRKSFTVLDHGIGMSKEDISVVWSQFGASEKMTNYDAIGSYGLGAKAPMSYCTEFYGMTIKDGIQTEFSVVRHEDDGLFVNIGEQVETSDPSGTQITVPVRSGDEEKFAKAAATYMVVSPTVPVEVNGLSDEVFSRITATSAFGARVPKPVYLHVDDVKLGENEDGSDILGRLLVDKKALGSLATTLFEPNGDNFLRGGSRYASLTFGYALQGWIYNGSAQQYRHSTDMFPSMLVELKPGLVDFVSSRDSIINNARGVNVDNYVDEYFKNTTPSEIFNKIIPLLTKTEADFVFSHLNYETIFDQIVPKHALTEKFKSMMGTKALDDKEVFFEDSIVNRIKFVSGFIGCVNNGYSNDISRSVNPYKSQLPSYHKNRETMNNIRILFKSPNTVADAREAYLASSSPVVTMSQILMAAAHARAGFFNRILLVEPQETKRQTSRLFARRKHAYFEMTFVIRVSKKVSKASADRLAEIAGVPVEIFEEEKFLAETKPARAPKEATAFDAAAFKGRSGGEVREENESLYSFIRRISYAPSFVELNEVSFNKDDILIFGHGRRDALAAISNSGVDLDGKDVFFFHENAISIAQLKWLKEQSIKVFRTPHFNTDRSAASTAFFSDMPAMEDKYLNEHLEGITKDRAFNEFVANYALESLSWKYSTVHRWNTLEGLTGALERAGHKAPAIMLNMVSARHTESEAPLTKEILQTHIDDAVLVEVDKVVALIDEINNSRSIFYNSVRTIARDELFSENNEDDLLVKFILGELMRKLNEIFA